MVQVAGGKAIDLDKEIVKSSDGIAITKQRLIDHLNKLGFSKKEKKNFFKKYKTFDYGFMLKLFDDIIFKPTKKYEDFTNEEEDLTLSNFGYLQEGSDFLVRFSDKLLSDLVTSVATKPDESYILLKLWLDFFAEKMYFYSHTVEETALPVYKEMKACVEMLEEVELRYFSAYATNYLWGWWD